MTQARSPARRCAIYTRKSSEEGLEQDFNSLHAQREACEAFIRSQAGEGWKLVKDAYAMGASLAAPWSGPLSADVKAGKIDTVVVYKVDRLTRSLADFAKIVELFDGANVSFVAVTQQFNTTSSMGRLSASHSHVSTRLEQRDCASLFPRGERPLSPAGGTASVIELLWEQENQNTRNILSSGQRYPMMGTAISATPHRVIDRNVKTILIKNAFMVCVSPRYVQFAEAGIIHGVA
jgi:hypothetical protein